jgi:hypothetical protein
MKIGEVFEPGNRKTTMTLIALVGTILLEKYGGGISGDLKEMILAILAIFTGGNVLSKGIQAAKEIKVQKQVVSEVVTDLVQEAQDASPPPVLVRDPDIDRIIEHVNKLDAEAGRLIKDLAGKVEQTNTNVQELSGRLDKQVHNLSEVLKIINGMRNGQQPTA